MTQIKDLSKSDLLALRQEITLNSLFLKDYSNSFDIDPQECYAFFDGYVEYLGELATEKIDLKNITDSDYLDLAFSHDNEDNLLGWWNCLYGGFKNA